MAEHDERFCRPISVAVTPSQIAAIEAAASHEGLAVASWVRRLVVAHLNERQQRVSPPADKKQAAADEREASRKSYRRSWMPRLLQGSRVAESRRDGLNWIG